MLRLSKVLSFDNNFVRRNSMDFLNYYYYFFPVQQTETVCHSVYSMYENTHLFIHAHIKPDMQTAQTHSCICCKHTDLSNARCALILSPSRNLSGFTFSLPELLIENDTHGSEFDLVLWHTHTRKHVRTFFSLSLSLCMCVAAQSCGEVGLWQLSLRRGCADQGWAENQGLAVLEGELHDSSPTWKPYLLAAASPTSPSRWSPRGRIHVCLTYLWLSVWLTPWLCVCLTNILTYPHSDLSIAWFSILLTYCLSLTFCLDLLTVLRLLDTAILAVPVESWQSH